MEGLSSKNFSHGYCVDEVTFCKLISEFLTYCANIIQVIKTTNRRVNAIEHVIIPKIERTLAYIISELGRNYITCGLIMTNFSR